MRQTFRDPQLRAGAQPGEVVDAGHGLGEHGAERGLEGIALAPLVVDLAVSDAQRRAGGRPLVGHDDRVVAGRGGHEHGRGRQDTRHRDVAVEVAALPGAGDEAGIYLPLGTHHRQPGDG